MLGSVAVGRLVRVLVVLACAGACVRGQFTGLSLDPALVAATNNAMSNLRGVLQLYTCSGSQLFEAASCAGAFNPQRYVLYSVVQTVVSNLEAIVDALRANNIVQGSGNLVQGKGNILIGNNDIVRGNNLWVFSCEATVGGSELLVMGNFRIDLRGVGALMANPAAVISCLNPTQARDYFSQFGGAAVAAQLAQVRLLI